jgi:hypothetical protein
MSSEFSAPANRGRVIAPELVEQVVERHLLLQTLSPPDENPLKSLGASETSPESVVMRRALAPLPLLLSSSSLSLPGEQVCSLPHTLFSLYCHTHQQFTLTAWRAALNSILSGRAGLS